MMPTRKSESDQHLARCAICGLINYEDIVKHHMKEHVIDDDEVAIQDENTPVLIECAGNNNRNY